MRLAETGSVRLEKNTIQDGLDCGVAVCSGSTAVLADNIVKGNGKANAIIYGEHRPTLLRNTIERSEQAGIYLYAKACATIEANEVRVTRAPTW